MTCIITFFVKILCGCLNLQLFKKETAGYAEFQGTYTEELVNIKHLGLWSYDIKKNQKYR